MKCNHCGDEIKPDCEWRQGRCPHRPAMIDVGLFYNLIEKIKGWFK